MLSVIKLLILTSTEWPNFRKTLEQLRRTQKLSSWTDSGLMSYRTSVRAFLQKKFSFSYGIPTGHQLAELNT
jgi:hypothetical protein